MSTPSERLWARRAEWDAECLPRPRVGATVPMSVAGAAVRVSSGVELRAAVADFMDDLRWAPDQLDVANRIVTSPSWSNHVRMPSSPRWPSTSPAGIGCRCRGGR
ncbi:MAG: hypothetical protein ACT4O0_04830 [Pseudonocardia sp.]|jgi:hypothetical protein